VTPPGNLRPYTHLVNLVAKRSSLLLDGGPAGSQEYMRWVRSLEQDFGVRIEVRTIMGADNRPAAIGGTISSAASVADSSTGSPTPSACAEPPAGRDMMPSDCQLAFTVDGDETRCALRYC
jgi:hypothetical protein